VETPFTITWNTQAGIPVWDILATS